MEVFNLTLSQMLMMFTFILVGFLLRKARILPNNSDLAMSRLETYFFVPALSLSNLMKNCTPDSLKENSIFILYGLVIVLVAMLVSYPLSKLFVRNSSESPEKIYERNIYKYALTFGNYGFMGNFIVMGIWGSEGLFKYLMFTFAIGILCNSWGLFILIPKENSGKQNLRSILKKILTPPVIALLTGIILGLLNVRQYIPAFFTNALNNASNCMGPVAMVLAGFVIGGYNLKNLLTNKKIYVVTLMRLIILPAIIVTILKLLGTSDDITTLALVAFGTPLGLNTIVYPAAYGGDTKMGASMAVISHILSVITIPLMYLVFIVLL